MNVDKLISRLNQLSQQGTPLETLLEEAVRGLHASDSRFHWTGIYELFEDNMLRLGPFVGAPTDHVFIGVGNGVCGTAIAERRNMNVPDVREITNYLACSTETRSELVVLIRSGETIYGQIDIDSHQVAAFDEDAVAKVEQVADSLAKAYAAKASRRATA
jgi:L-methionine (R)-S-oxide reductase